jgi:undecaprenyl diphosphate synthase
MSSQIDGVWLKHVAIIMDGNNRWAKRKGLPGVAGHKAGVERLRDVLDTCKEAGIAVVTVFAFSSENWQRPPKEVSALMSLFSLYLQREARKLRDEDVQLRVIGDRSRFSPALVREIAEAEATASKGHTTLVIAADYGGCWDAAAAARSLALKCAEGALSPDQINEDRFKEALSLGDLPPVDLLVRTGGEKRISNFLLFQAAYAELYFTDLLWPDFGRTEMQEAIAEFRQRQRRFGLSGEQIVGPGYA